MSINDSKLDKAPLSIVPVIFFLIAIIALIVRMLGRKTFFQINYPGGNIRVNLRRIAPNQVLEFYRIVCFYKENARRMV